MRQVDAGGTWGRGGGEAPPPPYPYISIKIHQHITILAENRLNIIIIKIAGSPFWYPLRMGLAGLFMLVETRLFKLLGNPWASSASLFKPVNYLLR